MDYMEGLVYPIGSAVLLGGLGFVSSYTIKQIRLISSTKDEVQEVMRRINSIDHRLDTNEAKSGQEFERIKHMLPALEAKITLEVDRRIGGLSERIDDVRGELKDTRDEMRCSFQMLQEQHSAQIELLKELIRGVKHEN